MMTVIKKRMQTNKAYFYLLVILLLSASVIGYGEKIKFYDYSEQFIKKGVHYSYRVEYNNKEYLVGFSENLFVKSDTDTIKNALELKSIAIIEKETGRQVEDPSLRNIIGNLIKPVFLSQIYYSSDENLNFLNSKPRLTEYYQKLIDVAKKGYTEIKDEAKQTSNLLNALDLTQESLGIAFEAALSGGTSLPGSILSVLSTVSHNFEYQNMLNSFENIGEKVEVLMKNNDFEALDEEYDLSALNSIIDLAAFSKTAYSQAGNFGQFAVGYLTIRDLNIAYGKKWVKEASKYIGKDGFLTKTAKEGMKNKNVAGLKILTWLLKTNTRQAQIAGLKIAYNLEMQLILLDKLQLIVNDIKKEAFMTAEKADSIVQLMTIYRFLDAETLTMINQYGTPEGLSFIHRTLNFFVDLFRGKPDIEKLIELDIKELKFYLKHSDYSIGEAEKEESVQESNTIKYKNFGLTKEVYPYNSNWDQIVNEQFGKNYRVADWKDLEDYYARGEDILQLFDGLGLTERGDDAYVKRNGDPNYTSSRFYFVERHEHNKRDGWLAHEDIDHYLISLGSWYGKSQIMAIKQETEKTKESETKHIATYGSTCGFRVGAHSDEYVRDHYIKSWNGIEFDRNIDKYIDESIDIITIGGDDTFSRNTAKKIEVAVYNDGKILVIKFWSNRKFNRSLPAVNGGNAPYGNSLSVVNQSDDLFKGLEKTYRLSDKNLNREHTIAKDGATVLLKHSNGDPALLYWQYGKGYVIQWSLECLGNFFEGYGNTLDTIMYRLLESLEVE